MTAPAASVAAVQKALGCEPWKPRVSDVPLQCWKHLGEHDAAPWTDRGCPVAVAAADAAVEALGLTWERGSGEVPGRSRWQRLVGEWQGPRP